MVTRIRFGRTPSGKPMVWGKRKKVSKAERTALDKAYDKLESQIRRLNRL